MADESVRSTGRQTSYSRTDPKPWRNSGRRISLALNSGNSSSVFAASSGDGDGSVCAKEKFVAARKENMIADSLFTLCSGTEYETCCSETWDFGLMPEISLALV